MALSVYLLIQALSLFILALSITILGLTINNVTYYNSFKTSTARLKSNNAIFPLFPANIDITSGGVWALFATGVGGTVDSLLLLGLFYYQNKKATTSKRNRWIYPTILFICFVSVVRSTTAMAYAFSEYSKSPSPILSGIYSTTGNYSVVLMGPGKLASEKWNRILAGFLVTGGKQASLAKQMTAARSLSVVVFVAYLMEAGMSLWIWRKDGRANVSLMSSSTGAAAKA